MKLPEKSQKGKYPKKYQYEYSDLTELIRESLDFDARYVKFSQENPEYHIKTWISIPDKTHHHQTFILNIEIWKIS